MTSSRARQIQGELDRLERELQQAQGGAARQEFYRRAYNLWFFLSSRPTERPL